MSKLTAIQQVDQIYTSQPVQEVRGTKRHPWAKWIGRVQRKIEGTLGLWLLKSQAATAFSSI
ncbi:hypothetical protein ACGYKB_17130 [Sulfitobacter sp. 916]|uniref:hypothetical protein n=1 Tax=Sulfitobacter sp. 916 TaxID=3368559 RepID=UPI0037455852